MSHFKPLVSVIIPTYNNSDFIVDTINSVLVQDYNNIEIIIINDGSTDDTHKVLLPYMSDIVYVEQKNKGPSVARNNGIKRAKGDFIAFIDSDDMWMSDKLNRQVEVFHLNPNAAIVYSKVAEYKDDYPNNIRVRPINIESGKIFEKILLSSIIPLSSVMIKKVIFDDIGLFDEDLMTAEDTNLWLRVSMVYTIVGIDEVLVKKRKHSRNISDMHDSIPVGTLDNLNKIVNIYPELRPGKYKPMKNAYLLRGTQLIRDYFYYGNYRQCRINSIKLLRKGIVNFDILLYYTISLLPSSIINFIIKFKRLIN